MLQFVSACGPAMSERVLNSEYEFVIVFDKNNAMSRQFDIFNADRGTLKNILRIKKNAGNEVSEIHNAAFPRPLPWKLITYFTNEGDLIYDAFIGTGTTAMVCVELKRNFIGSEINEQFFNEASKRTNNKQRSPSLFH